MYVSICILDDDHRVKLRPLPDHQDCQTDYINASYVDVCELIKNIPELYTYPPPHIIGLLHSKQILIHPRYYYRNTHTFSIVVFHYSTSINIVVIYSYTVCVCVCVCVRVFGPYNVIIPYSGYIS